MKTFAIFFLLFFITTLSLHSQSKGKPTIFDNLNYSPNHTLNFNVEGIHHNIVGELKDELLTFTDKVVNVSYNEVTNSFSVEFNKNMLIEDLKFIFNKYQINYYSKKEFDNNTNNL